MPASRISNIGLAFLNRFPLPNFPDVTGQRQYNFQFQGTNTQPREDKILRVDYNISSNDTMFVRLLQDYQDQSGYGAILGALGDGWGQFPHSYHIPSAGAAATYVHTFRSNLINEMTLGINRAHQGNSPTEDTLFAASQLPLKDASGTAIKLPNLFGANTLNLLPQVNFGLAPGFSAQSSPLGIPNLPQVGFDSRWPFDGTDESHNIVDNLTWIRGAHTLKAGFYFESSARNVSSYTTYNTAGAGAMIRERGERDAAAVLSPRAATIHGLTPLTGPIEGVQGNRTRFWIVQRAGSAATHATTGPARTTLLVGLRNEPGTLLAALAVIANAGVNISKLESRPNRIGEWEYIFWLDLDGAADAPEILGVMQGLADVTLERRILGSYPRGEAL